MASIAIRTDNLTRDFGSLRAVAGLTMEIPQGIVFGFLGPNGAGKTTTIRLLLGLLEPTEGSASVLGFDTVSEADQIRELTGALLEPPGLYDRLSAEDNLELYGRIWHLTPQDRGARIKELLSHLGLWDRRKEPAGSWSRGMRQKLAIARSLLHNPSLVFMDEPTAGLDPVAAAAVRDDLSSLSALSGVTVFLTTHNLEEAQKLCALVGVIREGKLVAMGHPDELRNQVGIPQVTITGRGFGDDVLAQLRARQEVAAVERRDDRLVIDLRKESETAPLVSLVVAAGAEVEEVKKGKASLEEVFLTLMEEGS